MTEETGTAPENADVTPESEEKPEETGETKESEKEESEKKEPEKDAEKPAPKPRRRRDKKIAELSYRNRELSRKVDKLLAVVEQNSSESAPKIDDFSTVDEYLDAKLAHFEKSRTREDELPPEQIEYIEHLQEARDDLISAGEEKYGDFEELVTSDGVKITPVMRDAIFELDDLDTQVEIAYHLAKHKKEASRIARLSPMRQVAEIGKLEIKLAAEPAKPKRPSKAPPPVDPVGGSKTSSDEILPEEDFESFLRKRNKQLGRG